MYDLIINGILLKPYDNTYYVGENGEIYSTHSQKFLKHGIDIDGYHRVDIHGKHKKVHRLVYETWIGLVPKGLQINHLDDNKNNNHYKNLYAGTQRENVRDCIENEHRIGNTHYLTVFDRLIGKVVSFCPASDFITYCGHPSANGSVKRFFSKNWFNKRYDIIDYRLGKV